MSDNTWVLIPLLAIGLGLGTMLTWLVLWHRHRLRDAEMRHAERMAAIQQGMAPPDLDVSAPPPPGGYPPPPPGAYPPPPPGVYPAPPPYPYAPRRMRGNDPARYLLRGLVWLGIGLALSFGRGPWDMGLNGFGWIAVAVGTAYLIYYGIDHGRYNGMAPPPPPPQGPVHGPGSGPDASWRNGPPPPPPPQS
jgi:hypothetical protein